MESYAFEGRKLFQTKLGCNKDSTKLTSLAVCAQTAEDQLVEKVKKAHHDRAGKLSLC